MEFFATCPASFERLLASELSSLGCEQVRPLKGQVSFAGDAEAALRACMWSRLASRVVLVLSRFEAPDADALYEGVSALPWEDHLRRGASVAIDAHGTNDALRNTHFSALRAKDALVDRMHARTGSRPQVNAERPDVPLVLRISRDRATLGLSLSGADPLFRRGYESAPSARSPIAPLRPDYAAALLALGEWGKACDKGNPALLSLFGGAGSVACEAACMAAGRAPGLLRRGWGFSCWQGFDASPWEAILAQAEELARRDIPQMRLASLDVRPGHDGATRQMLRSAGVAATVEFVRERDLAAMSWEGGLLACDLSWIGKASLPREAEALALLARAKDTVPLGRASVISHDESPDAALAATPTSTLSVVVGRDDARMAAFNLGDASKSPQVSLKTGDTMSVLVPASDQFARRLEKVFRERSAWAREEDVTCYRVYDADLPDYAVSIDLFEGSVTPGKWLQVSEYAPPKDVDESLAHRRLLDVLSIAPRVTGVGPRDVSLRVRSRSKGGSQYADQGDGRAKAARKARPGQVELPAGAHLVDEGGLTFEVNFSQRLDCGIFLDHRDTRAEIREMAKRMEGGRRFLNLFAYTGTATCYAADGGAAATTTVDLSGPSLAWARRNMARNGFTGAEHEYVQADVLSWVAEQRHTRNRWDLVFCDVPTFSNSKGMRKASFDVQRDHAELLIGVSRLLARGGTCVFSCNLRSFRPDEEKLARAGVTIEDVTARAIPHDFARTPKVHHCYLVRRAPRPAGQ